MKSATPTMAAALALLLAACGGNSRSDARSDPDAGSIGENGDSGQDPPRSAARQLVDRGRGALAAHHALDLLQRDARHPLPRLPRRAAQVREEHHVVAL